MAVGMCERQKVSSFNLFFATNSTFSPIPAAMLLETHVQNPEGELCMLPPTSSGNGSWSLIYMTMAGKEEDAETDYHGKNVVLNVCTLPFLVQAEAI